VASFFFAAALFASCNTKKNSNNTHSKWRWWSV
jgi:YbbR domain-containing protein